MLVVPPEAMGSIKTPYTIVLIFPARRAASLHQFTLAEKSIRKVRQLVLITCQIDHYSSSNYFSLLLTEKQFQDDNLLVSLHRINAKWSGGGGGGGGGGLLWIPSSFSCWLVVYI